jgi:hypothetical protein
MRFESVLQLWVLSDDGSPRRAHTLMQWAKWVETHDRSIGSTVLPSGSRVSTVFLAIPTDPYEDPPMLFETMVFHPTHDAGGTRAAPFRQRYATIEAARDGHRDAVDLFTRGDV